MAAGCGSPPRRAAAADHRCDLVIDVVYDAPRPAEVARRTGPDHRSGHRSHRHRMAGGIQWVRPGFAYLIDAT